METIFKYYCYSLSSDGTAGKNSYLQKVSHGVREENLTCRNSLTESEKKISPAETLSRSPRRKSHLQKLSRGVREENLTCRKSPKKYFYSFYINFKFQLL
jgi:hypothetical protein